MARLQFRRTEARFWAEDNPVLLRGEPGVELDTGQLKIGNGITHWLDLDYVGAGGSEDSGEGYPLSELGFIAATVSLEGSFVKSDVSNFVMRVRIPAEKPINKIWMPITDPSNNGGYVAFGVYDDDGNFVEKTANDTGLSATPWKGFDLLTPIPAQDQARFVHVAVAKTANAYVLYNNNLNLFGFSTFHNGIVTSKRRSWYVNTRTSFPSTIDVVSEGSNTVWLMVLALS